jgi:hypothetical protein
VSFILGGIILAVSYRFCLIKAFNNQKEYYKPMQLTLEGMEEEAECKYSLVNTNEITFEKKDFELINPNIVLSREQIDNLPNTISLDKYQIYIDILVNKKGKVFHKNFHRYLEPNEFFAYHVKELNIFIFSGTQKDVVKQFVHEINTDPNSGLILEDIEVDFKNLQPLVPVISGVWFGDMNKQFLRSAGYFGRHVDKSEEFKKALDGNAKISQLIFDYLFGKDIYSVGITKDSSIIMYSRIKDKINKIPDIKSEILLTTQIYNNFIARNSSLLLN